MKPIYVFLCVLLAIFLFFVLELVVEVILMFCGVNVHEHLVPHLYNTELKRNTVREHFSVDDKDLDTKVQQGIRNMATKRIVICALARDIEKYFPKCIEKVMLFTEGFSDYRIVIFENDSSDRTRNLLSDWTQRDKKVTLIDCCGEGSCECKLKMVNLKDYGSLSNKRISKMAQLRNRYLEYVKKNYSDYDYMMVLDIDIGGGIYKEGFKTCFANDDWDGIFARGTRPFPFMFGRIQYVYDFLPFVDKDPYEINISKHLKLQRVYNKKVGSDLVPVTSAFNGAGIYRIKSILGAKYDSKTPCEHIDFNMHFTKLYANPSFIINMGLDQDLRL